MTIVLKETNVMMMTTCPFRPDIDFSFTRNCHRCLCKLLSRTTLVFIWFMTSVLVIEVRMPLLPHDSLFSLFLMSGKFFQRKTYTTGWRVLCDHHSSHLASCVLMPSVVVSLVLKEINISCDCSWFLSSTSSSWSFHPQHLLDHLNFFVQKSECNCSSRGPNNRAVKGTRQRSRGWRSVQTSPWK